MAQELTPAQRAALEARPAESAPNPDAPSEPQIGTQDPALPDAPLVPVAEIAPMEKLGGVPGGGSDATVTYPILPRPEL